MEIKKKTMLAPLTICPPQIPRRLKNTVLCGEMSETDNLGGVGGQ